LKSNVLLDLIELFYRFNQALNVCVSLSCA